MKRTDSEGYAHILCALYVPEANFGCPETFEPIILNEIPKFRYDCKVSLFPFPIVNIKFKRKQQKAK